MDTIPGLKERLRKRRSELGWSQEQLARETRVSKNTVARWEKGATPAADLLGRLARALGVSTDWLLTGAGPSPLPATGTD